jgi:L,D-peptidoglycan transpeptidase YkuD (ErfK/YbiS/YcfS/YnhG family)
MNAVSHRYLPGKSCYNRTKFTEGSGCGMNDLRFRERLPVIVIGWLCLLVGCAGVMGVAGASAAASTTMPVSAARQLQTHKNTGQAILVLPAGKDKTRVAIIAYEKVKESWRQIYKMNGWIGKNGFASRKREGDGKSPSGLFTIGKAFGAYPDPGTELPYVRMTSKDVWVDDPKSPWYNTHQKLPVKGRWSSAEMMRRSDSLYDYGFVINYNTNKPVSGRGSAIFFHVASRPTAGCTGTSRENVLKLLRWLDPDKSPVIIQNPEIGVSHFSPGKEVTA